jgi:hypothetical protein
MLMPNPLDVLEVASAHRVGALLRWAAGLPPYQRGS